MNEITLTGARESKKTVLNLVCSIAEHLISGIIALTLTPLLIDRLGLELYGLYPVVLELSAVFGMIFGVVNSTSGRYIAIEYERGNKENAQKYFSSAFFANAVIGILLLLPMALVITLSHRLLNVAAPFTQDLKIFMILAFAAVVVDALSSVFGSVYYVTNRLELRSGQQFTSTAVKAVLLGTLLLAFRPSLTGVGVAILVSSTAGAAVQIAVSRRLMPDFSISLSSFSLSAVKRLTASGLWYSFNRIASFLMCGSMLILASRFFRASATGQYSVAFVLVSALVGIILTLGAVFVPISTKCFARGERKRLRDSLVRDERLIGCFASVAVSVAIAFCGDFLGLWIGDDAGKLTISTTILLLIPVLSLACATPIINVAMVMDKTRRFSLFFLSGGFLTLATALGVAYFGNLGVIGLAVVSSAAQLIWYSAAVPIFAGRMLECSPKCFLFPVLRVYLAAALSLTLCLAVNWVCDIKGWLALAIAAGCSCVVSAVISFLVLFFGNRS